MKNDILQIKKRLPHRIAENVESELEGIFTVIRHQRNEAGHPTGKKVTRDEMFVYLHLFITYCSHLYEIVKWLKTNSI